MLDECKGEKLMEILVVFSTAVVKRVVVNAVCDGSVAMRIASKTALGGQEQKQLLPLIISHRVSLRGLLNQKAETENRCLRFSTLLDEKTHHLHDRMEASARSSKPTLSPDVRARTLSEVTSNWPGNSRWPKVILEEDGINPGDQPLKKPFSEIWGVVVGGKAIDADHASNGLLSNLEQRVGEQKARLQAWTEYQREFAGGQRQSPRNQASSARPTFNFDKHQAICLPSDYSAIPATPLRNKNKGALATVLAELDNSKRDIGPGAQERPLAESGPQTIPTIQYTEYRPGNEMRSKPDPSMGDDLSISRPVLDPLGTSSVPLNKIFSPAKPEVPVAVLEDSQPSAPSGDSGYVAKDAKYLKTSGSNSSIRSESSDGQNDLPGRSLPTDQTSTSHHRLTLAERTRKSIFRATSDISDPDSEPRIERQPSKETLEASSIVAAGPSVADRRASLLERTQQSMSSLSANPRPHLRRSMSKKKQRQSIVYPVNQFETPGRPRNMPVRDTTPTERLFSDDADYASVFKSRPRIKMSPVPSPREAEMSENLSLLLEDDDLDDSQDIDGDSWVRSSPLRGRG